MPSIIEQIQRDALDEKVSVSALLRRVKLAATKLGLGVVEDWVERELNGYPVKVEIPEHRSIYGRPMMQCPPHGWQQLGGHIEDLSFKRLHNAIAELEQFALAPASAKIEFPYPDKVVERLNKMNGTEGLLAQLEVDPGAVRAVLDRVRNLVLDWALEMEKAGVVGTEFNFEPEDKRKAQAASTTIHIGTIGLFAGNLGAGNIARDISVRDVDVTQLRDLVDQLKKHSDELIAAGADGATLKARLASLEGEANKAAPASQKIRDVSDRACLRRPWFESGVWKHRSPEPCDLALTKPAIFCASHAGL